MNESKPISIFTKSDGVGCDNQEKDRCSGGSNGYKERMVEVFVFGGVNLGMKNWDSINGKGLEVAGLIGNSRDIGN